MIDLTDLDGLCAELATSLLAENEVVSISAGAVELVPRDDAESFAFRAETALQQAKANGRGTIVIETGRDAARGKLALHAASGDAVRRG